MGEDLKIKTLLERRRDLLERMLKKMKDPNEFMENHLSILKDNQETMDQIDGINEELAAIAGSACWDPADKEKLQTLAKKMQEALLELHTRKQQAVQEKRLLDQRDNGVDRYLSKEWETVFVNKNA